MTMATSFEENPSVGRRIDISGIVQGVGFRPYVYRLATERRLVGAINNTAAGVTIEVEGPEAAIEDFLAALPVQVPPLARITAMAVREIPCDGRKQFSIVSSRAGDERRVLISPDVAVCGDCLRELFDPTDRRHLYPFINCTNCGPRFTIVRDIPYDRALTSMNIFPMCPACKAEYDDPANRRFHAQPNACWECGPRVELWDREGRLVEAADPIAQAVTRLQRGEIVSVKGLGGFHLAVDATNAEAVELLRERKRRVEKPFAVMVRDIVAVETLCELDADSRALLEQPERPIVLLRKKAASPVANEVAPFNKYIGVFLPYTPVHHLLFASGRVSALVMTSGNLSEEPIAIANDEAVERLHELADCFLVHNRDILLRSDDSVVRIARGRTRQWRRSRGYVPVPVFLRDDVPPILAVGGELKNTICLTRGRHAFLSQHVGDLENLESYRFFEEAASHLRRILEIEPQAIAYDLHPNYFSTRWALVQNGVELIGVQHHHAHVASCMAENHLDGRVIGVALDGTGYGTDGRIWGGEILIADYRGFERAAHLAYAPLPGGEATIREPWRMALGYLWQHFGEALWELPIPFVEQLDRARARVVLRMVAAKVNTPLASSCGRLFDAVAALAGIRQRVNYEAQAAIELEMAIRDCDDSTAYPFELVAEGNGWTIDTQPMFVALMNDLHNELPAGAISLRFHNGLVETLARLCVLIRERTSLHRVCLSGGTFQNVFLLEHLTHHLETLSFAVFTHSEVPAGDGGLSLGQAMVAAHRLEKTNPEE